MRYRLIPALPFLMIFFSLIKSPCLADELSWTFKEPVAPPGWEMWGVEPSFDRGGVVLKGMNRPRIVSPALDIPAIALFIKMKSNEGGIFAVGFLSSSNKVYTSFLRLKGGTESSDYRIYAGDLLKPDESISRLIIEFPEGASVTLDSIGFYTPAFAELLKLRWEAFWAPEIVKGSTINYISNPAFGTVSFIIILYGVVVISAFAILVFRFSRGRALERDSIARAFLISFFIGAFLYTVRMDYNWLKMWGHDRADLSGKDAGGRQRVLYKVYDSTGDFLDFINRARSAVPVGEKVRPAVKYPYDQFALIGRYFFLPVMTSVDGRFIWTYNDKEVYFDPNARSLKSGNGVIAYPVRPVPGFFGRAGLYEILKEDIK